MYATTGSKATKEIKIGTIKKYIHHANTSDGVPEIMK
jgi:hypothetical protein